MSISECGYWSRDEISEIWDFYVTKSVASSSSQRRTAANYGLKFIPFDTILTFSGVPDNRRDMLKADSIPGVLKEYDFEYFKKGTNEQVAIDIDSPRLVCIQPYSITDRGEPVAKGDGKGVTLLTHIRNSLAHGLTFFFDNGMMLLEDKAGGSSGKTTAMMLLPQTALLDWLRAIDINAQFYSKSFDRSPYSKLVTKLPVKKTIDN